MTCTVTWVFYRYVRGYRGSRIAIDRQVVNVLIGNINDVFNDRPSQEANWHRHMTRADSAVDYHNTNLKVVKPLANKVTLDERNRSVVSAI